MLKSIIKKFIIIYISIQGNIKIDLKSNVSKRAARLLIDRKRDKRFPIEIKNSYIDNVNVKEGCKISNCSCSGNINLGKFVSINGPGTRISARINSISIGSFSSIASNVVIQEDYHDFNRATSYFIMQNLFKEDVKKDVFSKGDIIIEEDVWIGSNTVILSGINIGRGAIVGAGSIVTKDVPRYAIVCGNPAKVIKYRFEKSTIEYLEDLKWWEWDIDEIKENKKLFEKNLNLQKAEYEH